MRITSIIAITIALASCGSPKEKSEAPNVAEGQNGVIHLKEGQKDLSGLEFGKLSPVPIYQRVRCSGIIDVPPQNKASISASLSGRVSEVNFYPGDEVSKGEVLCKLRDATYIQLQEDFLNALEEEAYLEKELARKTSLSEASAISDKELLNAAKLQKKAKITRQSLREKLLWLGFDPMQIQEEGIQPELFIRSPFKGFITEMNINLGKQVEASELLYEIVDPSHLHLEMQVYQKDLPFIEKGQPIKFSFSENDQIHSGEVFLVGQKVDQTSRKVRVHGHFDSHERDLKPGALFQAEILVGQDTLLALPEAAFSDAFGSAVVYMKEQDHIKPINVEKGPSDGGMVALVNFPDSLKNRDFVIKGAYYVGDAEPNGHGH